MAPSNPHYLVNIGLDRSHDGNVDTLPAEHALKVLADEVPVLAWAVRQSMSEPTLVAAIQHPLAPKQAHALACRLGQECIAVLNNGQGSLHGPGAIQWGAFNARMFLLLDGHYVEEGPAA